METIVHRTVEVNGIKMHVAEKGEGPAVLFLHGFPELWYSWRHQILALAARGFRAVAPDLRGYGDTEGPADVAAYSIFHIVGDLVALIDSLVGQDKVFVVGHDWGALVAWSLCMFRPDRVKALVNLSVAFKPRNPTRKTVEYFTSTYGDDYYICKFQEPGVAEAEFARYGFTNPINYYRNMDLNWELTAPWAGTQIKVPTKFVVGDEDLTYHYPGIQDYIRKGGMQKYVPFLEEVVVMPGVSHWINQEKADDITEHIYDFITKF